jgi:N6-adenosine-specific RNA methylase IME4
MNELDCDHRFVLGASMFGGRSVTGARCELCGVWTADDDDLDERPEDSWEGLDPPYGTIVADPPWRFGSQAGAVSRGHARKHYSTMDMDALVEMPVVDLAAPDAHLWLWCTNALMEDGYRIVRAWGFKPVTLLTWCKSGPGVGYYLRNNTEHAIFATRGNPVVPEDKPLSTWFQWPSANHSAKPAGFGDIVEQVSPGPYLELFCRQPRFGWDSWGHGYEIGASSA